jgi:hypothetical protein
MPVFVPVSGRQDYAVGSYPWRPPNVPKRERRAASDPLPGSLRHSKGRGRSKYVFSQEGWPEIRKCTPEHAVNWVIARWNRLRPWPTDRMLGWALSIALQPYASFESRKCGGGRSPSRGAL